MKSEGRSSLMMTNDQNARAISNYAKKKMVGKLFEVHPSEIALTNTEGFRMTGRLLKECP